MKWTTEPPKEPGYYWHRQTPGGKIVLKHLWRVDGEKICFFYNTPFGEMSRNVASPGFKFDFPEAQWAGPIPEPEE